MTAIENVKEAQTGVRKPTDDQIDFHGLTHQEEAAERSSASRSPPRGPRTSPRNKVPSEHYCAPFLREGCGNGGSRTFRVRRPP
jgi:hypothetical protein